MSGKSLGPWNIEEESWNLRCLRSVWYCCCCWYCFCRDACGVRPNALFGSGFKGNIERNRLLETIFLIRYHTVGLPVLSKTRRLKSSQFCSKRFLFTSLLKPFPFVHIWDSQTRMRNLLSRRKVPGVPGKDWTKKSVVVFFQSSAITNCHPAIEFFDTNRNRFSNAVFPFLEHALKKHFSR